MVVVVAPPVVLLVEGYGMKAYGERECGRRVCYGRKGCYDKKGCRRICTERISPDIHQDSVGAFQRTSCFRWRGRWDDPLIPLPASPGRSLRPLAPVYPPEVNILTTWNSDVARMAMKNPQFPYKGYGLGGLRAPDLMFLLW